jgi:hypothetical protein
MHVNKNVKEKDFLSQVQKLEELVCDESSLVSVPVDAGRSVSLYYRKPQSFNGLLPCHILNGECSVVICEYTGRIGCVKTPKMFLKY